MMGGALALLLLALSATRAAAAPLAIDGQKIVDQVWCRVHVQQNLYRRDASLTALVMAHATAHQAGNIH